MNILLAVTGSVAAIRAPRLASSLSSLGSVRAAFTSTSVHFLKRSEDVWPTEVEQLFDADEWKAWNQLGDPVIHIELRKWADVLVVAPATADFIAKTVNGFSDNLVLSVCRAWDFTKPFLIAPAMNTMMWEHPITYRQIATLQAWGVRIVEPISKELACGDVGMGGMADVDAVTSAVRAALTPGR
jgi:phosphopantothenoylcysteine decarboxylase